MLFSLLVLWFASQTISPPVSVGCLLAGPSKAAIDRGGLPEDAGNGGDESHIARALLQDAEEFFVGGYDAPKDRFPYACSLRVDGTRVHGCGGALIGTKWVLTAAHCVTGSESVGPTPIVYVGAYETQDPGGAEVIKSVDVFIHEDWNGNVDDGNDIALLLLETDATKTYLRLPHSTHEPGISQILMGVGWGRISKHGSLPGVLQLADKLEYVRNDNCQNVWSQVKESMLCAHANSQAPCQGDSGGPLVLPDTEGGFENGNSGYDILVGLVSFGPDDCGESEKGKIKPGVFTRISFFRGWIDEKMGKGSTATPVSEKSPDESPDPPSQEKPPKKRKEPKKPSKPPPSPSPPPADDDKASGGNPLKFLKAAKDGDIEVVKQEVENRVDLEATGTSGTTALLYAAQNGHPDIILFLIEKGADFQAADDNGNIAMEWGGFFGHIEVLQVLMDHGVDIDERGGTGANALFSAAEGGQLNSLKFLLDNGAEVDGPYLRTGGTPLFIATEKGFLPGVEELIARGADVNAKNDRGIVPLMVATRKADNAEVINALIDGGADVDGKDSNGEVSLHYAAFHGRKANIEALLSKGADKTIVNEDGETPRDQVCRCLLSYERNFCDVEQCEKGVNEIQALFD